MIASALPGILVTNAGCQPQCPDWYQLKKAKISYGVRFYFRTCYVS